MGHSLAVIWLSSSLLLCAMILISVKSFRMYIESKKGRHNDVSSDIESDCATTKSVVHSRGSAREYVRRSFFVTTSLEGLHNARIKNFQEDNFLENESFSH